MRFMISVPASGILRRLSKAVKLQTGYSLVINADRYEKGSSASILLHYMEQANWIDAVDC